MIPSEKAWCKFHFSYEDQTPSCFSLEVFGIFVCFLFICCWVVCLVLLGCFFFFFFFFFIIIERERGGGRFCGGFKFKYF